MQKEIKYHNGYLNVVDFLETILKYKLKNNLYINKIEMKSIRSECFLKIFIDDKIFILDSDNDLESSNKIFNYIGEEEYLIRILNNYNNLDIDDVDIQLFCNAIPYLISELKRSLKFFE